MTKTSGGSPGGPSGGGPRGEIAGVPTRWIAGGVIAVLAIWFLFANLDDVQIRFWVFTVTAPLWIALLGTVLVGGAAGWLLRGRRTR
ncbi:LapA family protein [Kitasatospora sp. NPDC093679]|uniref:LapA family protein n=1 Tax=Kitasatospora sp. NPDC093679 TaxID=3154983 RepID=UPI00343B6819